MGIWAVHSRTHKFTRHPNKAIGQITFIPFGKGLPILKTGSLRLKNERRGRIRIARPVYRSSRCTGKNGIESIVEIQLNEAEKTKLTASAAAVQKTNGLLTH